MLLVREFEKRVGFVEGLSNCLEDTRTPYLIRHSYKEILTQRIFQIACGYEEADDCDLLRDKPYTNMFERDYIMRLIRQFFEFLTKLIELKKKNKEQEAQVYLCDMYQKFLKHPPTYYYGQNSEEIINSFDEEHQEYYLEMLAELFYQDALMKDDDRELLTKSCDLYEYANRHSSSFSLTRYQRIETIKNILED